MNEEIFWFFEGKPVELELYRAFEEKITERFGEVRIKVGKTQISFANRYNFAFVSLPLRKRKGWPEKCILVTFGLGYQKVSERIAIATEAYPNRWTHHVLVQAEEELDEELMGWVEEAYQFSLAKR